MSARGLGRPALAALSFLTAVPVARRVELGVRDLERGAVLFPVVGAAVGLLVASTAWLAARALPPTPSAIVGVAIGVAVTAAFHLDGLGDVADGIGAALTGRPVADVMRDPRLGTFGVAAVALHLLLKVSLVAVLVAGGFPWEIVAAGAIARVAPIALAWRLPYAGSGTGAWIGRVRAWTVGAATLIALAVTVPTARLSTIGMLVVMALVSLGLGRWSHVRLGGVTGDVFGAAAELSETLAIAAAVAAIR